MRWAWVITAVLVLAAGCGAGDGEAATAGAVEVRFELDSQLANERLQVRLVTDLPDGAFVRCSVWAGDEDDPVVEELADCTGPVTDGGLVADVDLAGVAHDVVTVSRPASRRGSTRSPPASRTPTAVAAWRALPSSPVRPPSRNGRCSWPRSASSASPADQLASR